MIDQRHHDQHPQGSPAAITSTTVAVGSAPYVFPHGEPTNQPPPRYVIQPPSACSDLELLGPGDPSTRHASFDWSDTRQTDRRRNKAFCQTPATELILSAGEILYLPSVSQGGGGRVSPTSHPLDLHSSGFISLSVWTSLCSATCAAAGEGPARATSRSVASFDTCRARWREWHVRWAGAWCSFSRARWR